MYDVNDLLDMEEDYYAQLLDDGKISEDEYNKHIDYLEELRE